MSTVASTGACPAPHTLPGVGEAFRSILDTIAAAQTSITGAQGATSADNKQTLDELLDRLAPLKGRGAFYPYVGSGLGNGPLVQLVDGSVKWDMINGIGVHMFGHGSREMLEAALEGAVVDLVMQGNLQYNDDVVEMSSLLAAEAGKTSALTHVFLTNSGALANENALKVCFQKKDGRAPRVLAFRDCFMGRTTTMAQLGDSAGGRQGIPLSTQVDYMPFYDGEGSIEVAMTKLNEYIARYPGQYACFAMELVQGEGGFKTAPREFFVPLMERCREAGIAVWADEIQTFGRNESMFYHDQLGLGEHIDVVTIGKMSQVCATLYTDQFNPKPGLLSGTFVGSTVALKVGRRSLEMLRDGGFYGPDGKIAKLQQAFRERCESLVERRPEFFQSECGCDCKCADYYGGVGGMMRLTPFGGDKSKVAKLLHCLFDNGVIGFMCGHGPYHLRFLPPVGVMQPAQFDDVFAILETSLAQVHAETN